MDTHDIDARHIGMAAGAIGLAVAACIATAFALLHGWDMPARVDRVRLPYRVSMPEAALQSAPQFDLARYRAEKQHLLDGAAWLDAQHGSARIPIASAMALLAQSPAAGASRPEAQP